MQIFLLTPKTGSKPINRVVLPDSISMKTLVIWESFELLCTNCDVISIVLQFSGATEKTSVYGVKPGSINTVHRGNNTT